MPPNNNNNNNNMCYGKLPKNVSPVCDTADLHVSTLYLSPRSYKQWLIAKQSKQRNHVIRYSMKNEWLYKTY